MCPSLSRLPRTDRFRRVCTLRQPVGGLCTPASTNVQMHWHALSTLETISSQRNGLLFADGGADCRRGAKRPPAGYTSKCFIIQVLPTKFNSAYKPPLPLTKIRMSPTLLNSACSVSISGCHAIFERSQYTFVQIRVGMHSGSVSAAVMGTVLPRYLLIFYNLRWYQK